MFEISEIVIYSMTEEVLDSIAAEFQGPGGAIAVIRNGELVATRTWGFSDTANLKQITTKTLMPICSMSKQQLVMVYKQLVKDGKTKQINDAMNKLLEGSIAASAGILASHICDNQSGIRDYWAVTMLLGSKPEGRYSQMADWDAHREQYLTTHFPAGQEYSYCNCGFRLLGQAVATVEDEPLEKLISKYIWEPAKMTTARMCIDTSRHPDPATDPNGCIGYEGNADTGFIPVVNNVEWCGDAGVVASLEDMIAYEKWVDRSMQDPDSLYSEIFKQKTYNDGTKSGYGNGLMRLSLNGIEAIKHGGGVRGFRLCRMQVPSKRLSVVVLLNHEDFEGATVAEAVITKLFNLKDPFLDLPPAVDIDPTAWNGTYLDQGTMMAFTAKVNTSLPRPVLDIKYDRSKTRLIMTGSEAKCRDMEAKLVGETMVVNCVYDHRILKGRRILSDTPKGGYEGDYSSDEFHTQGKDRAVFHCEGDGSVYYGWFKGVLGQGDACAMKYLGQDVFYLRMSRALDAPAPGDWTVVFKRNSNGAIVSVQIGCWLARNTHWTRI